MSNFKFNNRHFSRSIKKTRTLKSLIKIKKFVNTFKWVHKTWYPSIDISVFLKQIEVIERWFLTKGPEWVIKRVKLLRLSFSRILAETPLQKQDFLGYHNKSLYPKLFDRDLLDKRDIGYIKLQYTLLEISKIIDHWGSASYDSITDFPTSIPKTSGIELANIYKKHFFTDLNSGFEEFHYSIKSGPLGPATCSSIGEIKIISNELYENIAILGGSKLRQSMDNCKRIMEDVLDHELNGKFINFPEDFSQTKSDEMLRKIALVRDPEMKLRPIAIFDYWSQSSLYWLHQRCFAALEKFSQDCTFNHGHAKMGETNFCFDLTAATDRFPLVLQKEFLGELIGKERASAWEAVMVSTKFKTPEGKSVSYNTGQPMGAYSSWTIFTLCHHLIVQKCAEECNIALPFTKYYLLGDDIVIQDSTVASSYVRKLEDLGVDISEQKTIKSKIFMEFAKRHWYKGIEVTPFHIGAVLETYKSWIMLYSYWNNMSTQGWKLPGHGIMHTKQLLVSLGDPKAYARRKSRNINSLQLLTSGLKGYPNNSNCFNELLKIANFDISCNHKRSIAQEYILEVIGSLKLQVVIDALVDNVKIINKEVNTFIKILSFHTVMQQDDLSDIPAIEVLIKRSKDLMEETNSCGELIDSGFINLARKEFVMLPDPTRVISLRPLDVSQTSLTKTFINRLFSFLRKEVKQIEDAYRL
jgi:hypothetical protein